MIHRVYKIRIHKFMYFVSCVRDVIMSDVVWIVISLIVILRSFEFHMCLSTAVMLYLQ